MSRGTVPVTVVIAARNESAEIAACIESAAWAAEVLVVENDSSDDTVQQAQAAGATVFTHVFSTIGAQRNAAITRAAQPWIFVLDADERASESVGRELAQVIAGAHNTTAFRARRRNFFLGREVCHGGWERDMPVRLFVRTLRYDERPVHEHVITMGSVGSLQAPLLHTPYASLDEYFEKLHRYSKWWALQHHARGRSASLLSVVGRPVGRFITMLVVRGGWRDGAVGVMIATLGAMSVAAKYAHLWWLTHAPNASPARPR